MTDSPLASVEQSLGGALNTRREDGRLYIVQVQNVKDGGRVREQVVGNYAAVASPPEKGGELSLALAWKAIVCGHGMIAHRQTKTRR
jgi:hypothetical protein